MRSDILTALVLLKGEMEKLNEKIETTDHGYEFDQYCQDYDHLESTMEYLANIENE